MRLATVKLSDGTVKAGRVAGGEVILLPFTDVGELLAAEPDWPQLARRDGRRVPLAAVQPTLLVPAPSKVLCVGRNYLEHVTEGNADNQPPDFPELFAKYRDALTGPYDQIAFPPGKGNYDWAGSVAAATKVPVTAHQAEIDCVDWEAELVVVIGRTVRRANEAEAEDAIAGFTVGNDTSVRDWQLRTSQWLQGKSWDRLSPVGPVLVTPDEVGGIRPDLRITCSVDGDVTQDSRTSLLIFGPVDLVCYISRFTTLRPGDLIFTGTPSGVGIVRKPERYLLPGQVLRTAIEGIGEMANLVVAEELHAEPADRA
jgi:acylpyruvate hydrolase